jgi:hypothetical protein
VVQVIPPSARVVERLKQVIGRELRIQKLQPFHHPVGGFEHR